MSDELNVWRDANSAFSLGNPGRREQAAAAVIRDYGDRRDADAYQRGKLEGARLALEAAADRCDFLAQFPLTAREKLGASIRALDPAKIVGEG